MYEVTGKILNLEQIDREGQLKYDVGAERHRSWVG